MIYRIAIGTIVDGKWKFSHYAPDEEYQTLRITPDMKVAKLGIQEHMWNTITGNQTYIIAETDVSDTHKVEFGYKLYGQEVYSGDIIETIYNEVYEIGTMPVFFMNLHDMGLRKNNYKVIGNIHENPELLEVNE